MKYLINSTSKKAMPRAHNESSLQRACVRWFALQYTQHAGMLFHVPNGGYRNKIEAAKLKQQGVVPGVADLILLIPRAGFGSLCIEMKAGKGKQSENQKNWEESAKKAGNMYVVCRSIDEFINTINYYLQ